MRHSCCVYELLTINHNKKIQLYIHTSWNQDLIEVDLYNKVCLEVLRMHKSQTSPPLLGVLHTIISYVALSPQWLVLSSYVCQKCRVNVFTLITNHIDYTWHVECIILICKRVDYAYEAHINSASNSSTLHFHWLQLSFNLAGFLQKLIEDL